MFVDFFIRRPVFASVCALLIILAGAASIPSLPIALYPPLAPPLITVTATYIGANAAAVEHDVTTPLEEAINGVKGMRYISSTSSNDGVSNISITFETGYNEDIAAVDVQNRISSASGVLPQIVKNTGVSVTKANPNYIFAAGFYAEGNRYSQEFISNYLDLYVRDPLKRISGVGDAPIFAPRKYAMRLWLNPVKLAALQLTASDVLAALEEQNVEIAAGAVGQPPLDRPQDFQITVRAVGRLTTPEEFEDIVLKRSATGITQLRDVGRAELGSEDYSNNLSYSRKPSVGIGIQQLAGSNALEVDRNARAKLLELAKDLPPGLHYVVAFDLTEVVSDSVHEVTGTLSEAIGIVILVIFFFLLDWRATLIPAISIPVSLVGTFAFIKLFGFSLNTLTLFGIILATGLVVDDAIVVVENVQRHLSSRGAGIDSHVATSDAMAEVTSAVVATSMVLISVFIPVSLFPGVTGELYKQFSLTIAFSIALSTFNALTLSPALAALLLRSSDAEANPRQSSHRLSRLYHQAARSVENAFERLSVAYARSIRIALRWQWTMLLLFVLGLFATVLEYRRVPTAFVPAEDQGYFPVQIQAPQGASLAYTTHLADRVQQIILDDPDVVGCFSNIGSAIAGSANGGIVFVSLRPQDQRRAAGHADNDVIARLSPKLASLSGGIIVPFAPPSVPGIGSYGGFQFELQDQGRNKISDLDRVAHEIVAASQQPQSGLVNLFTSFTSNDPQILVKVDRDKAKSIGVSLSQINDALSVYMGSTYVNDFEFNDRAYRVYVQADAPYRRTAHDMQSLYVRADSGAMVPLDNLVTVTETAGPQTINHFNLFRSAEIDGAAAPGVASSVGLDKMRDLAQKSTLNGMSFEWAGLARDEAESGSKSLTIFVLGFLVVYLTLAAQYESFSLPFIILLAVPMAVLGALGFVELRGLNNDVYVQIGLVLLIGLAAKNAILIVEFAEQKRKAGHLVHLAAVEAAQQRLRPILMTSFAFILGVLPLVFATGAGKLGRHSVGTTIVGGMLVSTVLNLFFVPVIYVFSRSDRRSVELGG